MAHSLVTIPEELQVLILSYLDVPSRSRWAMTCKYLYAVHKSASLLLYTVELRLDGLKDAGTSIPSSDLVKLLVQRRQAWLSLENQEHLFYYVEPDCCGHELTGGAFAYTCRSNDRLGIVWLPTIAGTPQEYTLQVPSLGIAAVRNFTMDPTQDLIVFLEDDGTLLSNINIHIRSISINNIHPRAQRSPLRLKITLDHTNGSVTTRVVLQIAYNILAICFYDASKKTQILIWDWTTSELIFDSSVFFDPSIPTSKYDFGLLDSTHFFITCPSDFGSIRLYELVRDSTLTSFAVHLATLHLPPTTHGNVIVKISSHAGPIEAKPLSQIPFIVHDEDRLHMFMLEYKHKMAGMWRIKLFNLFLHQRVLSKYARRALKESSPLDIPWAEWGPPNTRLITSSLPPYASQWKRYIYGQRALFPAGKIGHVGHRLVSSRSAEVYDFSLAAVLLAKGVLEMPPSFSRGNFGMLLLPSTIRTEDFPLFLDDVKTHLPCVMSSLELMRSYTSYMIYADGIVGMTTGGDIAFSLDIYPV